MRSNPHLPFMVISMHVYKLYEYMKDVQNRCEGSNTHRVKLSVSELIALQQVVEHLRKQTVEHIKDMEPECKVCSGNV